MAARVEQLETAGEGKKERRVAGSEAGLAFKMPLNYPRYKLSDYETMPEWKLDFLLAEYGLSVSGDLNYKRSFAAGAFLWPPTC